MFSSCSLLFFLLLVTFEGYVTADDCNPDVLQKCADIIEFLSDRKSVIGGDEMIDDLCSFSDNTTICANKAADKCPDLKKEDAYETLLRITKKIKTEVCGQDSEIRKTYSKHEKCLEKVTESEALKCVQDFIVILRLFKQSTDKEICCSYEEAKDCIHELVKAKCGEDAAQATVQVAGLLSGPLTEPRCLVYNTTMCTNSSPSFSSNYSFIISLLLLALIILL